METISVDVLVIGAGVSGLSAACHLQSRCPDKSCAILEARERLGGTWDLFRFPGVRSDSDMYTFGFSFKPWKGPRFIADGRSILAYLTETAREHGIDQRIRYGHRARRAAWSSDEALWTVDVEQGPDRRSVRYRCRFLHVCAGYYDYARGHTPEFAGMERFTGAIVHPQQWREDNDYTGKRVVVIGSGATAVTLIPELARSASHVTMLQRSPTYMISWPTRDRVAEWLRLCLPGRIASAISRWQYVLIMTLFFRFARWQPALTRKWLIGRIRNELGRDCDVDRHFVPKYNPWDQRVCLVPDGDLFQAIRDGKVSVVTDRIETFTETGIALASGAELDADLIVTATGLELQMISGLEISVDGAIVDMSQCLQYKGTMFSAVPNLAACFGYTNASWTLKADLVSEYLCRLLKHMDRTAMRQCTPILADATITPEPFLDFSSGYIRRSVDRFAKQGSRRPWRLHQNYIMDISLLRYGRIDDGTLVFSNPAVSIASR